MWSGKCLHRGPTTSAAQRNSRQPIETCRLESPWPRVGVVTEGSLGQKLLVSGNRAATFLHTPQKNWVIPREEGFYRNKGSISEQNHALQMEALQWLREWSNLALYKGRAKRGGPRVLKRPVMVAKATQDLPTALSQARPNDHKAKSRSSTVVVVAYTSGHLACGSEVKGALVDLCWRRMPPSCSIAAQLAYNRYWDCTPGRRPRCTMGRRRH